MTAEAKTRAAQSGLEDSLQRVIETYHQSGDSGETERHLPQSLFEAMRDEGLFSLWAPAEYGGHELPLPEFMRAVERLAEVDAATGWTFAILSAGPLLSAYLPSAGGKQVFAAGPNTSVPGSVAGSGRAIPVDGGYRLTGRWPLASAVQFGDWVGATGLVIDGDAPRMLGEMPDMHTFFVRPEDCQWIDTWHSLGMRGTGSIDFVVENAFVPAERASSLFGSMPQVSGALFKAGPLVLFSMAISAIFPGIARNAIDAFKQLAKAKTPTLSQSGLATRPTIHAAVARAEAQLLSARAFLYETGHEVMNALETTGAVPEDVEARRRLACANVADACRAVVDSMFTLAGSTPVYSGHRLERCLRDIHTAGQHLVVSPVWWEKTGQYYFGLGLGMP